MSPILISSCKKEIKLNLPIAQTPHILFEGGGGIDLTKSPKKGGIGKLLKGTGDPKKKGSVGKGGMLLVWVFFLAGGVANVLTFNYILFILFLFPLNVGVSPYFHCTVLVPVYRVYTSCFHNTFVSSCYRLHASCLHPAGVTSCFSLNMRF